MSGYEVNFGSQQGSTIRCNGREPRPVSMRVRIERLALGKTFRPPHLVALIIGALALSGPTDIGHAEPLKDSSVNAGSVSPAKAPNGVSANWWRSVQRGLAEAEYHPSKSAKGLQAPNRAHNLRTYFGPTGIRLHDRTAVGGTRLVGLSLAGLGRGGDLAPVAAGQVAQSGKRVEIRRPGIVEWYENTPKGLEQGFTLATRVGGKGKLVLEIAVERAKALLRGNFIEMRTDSGRRLRYGKLIVQDATGRILVSRLEAPSPQRIRLVVVDAGAVYPLVIDPLVTGTRDAILESNDPDTGSFDSAIFGNSVAGAGDVNGDGFADVIVGAPGWDNGLFDEGAAFVFLGSAGGIV